MKIINVTWEDVSARINYIKKKHKITSKTKVFGVPKNGMILAGFLGAINLPSPDDADIIIDDIIDSGATKKKFKKMFPKKKFITLFEKDKKIDWVNFPFEKNTDADHQDFVMKYCFICLILLYDLLGMHNSTLVGVMPICFISSLWISIN